jgi:hypothetical protein
MLLMSGKDARRLAGLAAGAADRSLGATHGQQIVVVNRLRGKCIRVAAPRAAGQSKRARLTHPPGTHARRLDRKMAELVQHREAHHAMCIYCHVC